MKKIFTLSNSFHKSSVRFEGPDAWAGLSESDLWLEIQGRARGYLGTGEIQRVYRRKEARIRRALCGMTDCTCGTVR